MNQLLVIGGVSIDVLHLKDRTVETAGGAAMYTAMAANRCGAQVVLFGPRPEPCQEILEPVSVHLPEWLGPATSPEQVLRFEISYQGGKTEYLKSVVDAEEALSPTELPSDLSDYDMVHVTPLGGVSQQLSFIQTCRDRGAKLVSAGTWPGETAENPEGVQAVIEQTDLFFMNNREAKSVFGSLQAAHTLPGKLLFITLGSRGACVLQGGTASMVPGVSATVLDPTGAGDTFCGATLAFLLQKQHPIMAARQACALAAEMIENVGPAALLTVEPPPRIPPDLRVQVNPERIRKIAEQISMQSDGSPFTFVSPDLPPVGHPKVVDYFFAATLQQFSFFSTRDNHYHLPLIDSMDGVQRKGSDYLWYAITCRLDKDPEFCSPERQANLSREELLEVFRADNGEDPMPALDLHLEQAQVYGRDMLTLQLTPQAVLDISLSSPQPLETFLVILDQVGGYKEDPLRKKSLLLAMILNDRPEQFFPLREDEQIAPIMDYHFQRSCLRIGLIDVLDRNLVSKLVNREVVSKDEEWAVRYPSYHAVEELVRLSGQSMGAVNDLLFTNARKHCPEMTEPECPSCILDPVCAHRREFFQPVIRTAFY